MRSRRRILLRVLHFSNGAKHRTYSSKKQPTSDREPRPAASRPISTATNSQIVRALVAVTAARTNSPPRSRGRKRLRQQGGTQIARRATRSLGSPRLTQPPAEFRRNEGAIRLGANSSFGRGRHSRTKSNVFSRKQLERVANHRLRSNHANRKSSRDKETGQEQNARAASVSERTLLQGERKQESTSGT
jgi:hypothetical protein